VIDGSAPILEIREDQDRRPIPLAVMRVLISS